MDLHLRYRHGHSLTVCAINLNPTSHTQFTPFLWGMLGFSSVGIGNAGTFKQMPMIMPKRQAGGAIGFTAAIAAFGPFLVGMALASFPAQAFFTGCVVYCVLCSILCWAMGMPGRTRSSLAKPRRRPPAASETHPFILKRSDMAAPKDSSLFALGAHLAGVRYPLMRAFLTGGREADVLSAAFQP